MNQETKVKKLFLQYQVLLTNGHFVLASGRHSDCYINKDALAPHTKLLYQLCGLIAQEYKNQDIQVVAGAANGGIALSQWTAWWLTKLTKQEVLAVYADKDTANGGFLFRRGYDQIIAQKRVLVVEDILTTGQSTKRVVEKAKECDAHEVGVAALCNRGNVTKDDLNAPGLTSLLTLSLESYGTLCPMCESGKPIDSRFGHGKEFLDHQIDLKAKP